MSSDGTARPPNNIGGIYCILAAMAVITLQDSAVKWLSSDYALHQIMLARSMLGLTIILVILRLEGGLRMVKSRAFGWLVLRGGFLVMANMAFFLAVSAMPLAEAVAIFFVAPLFITLLSVVVLGEKVGPRRWTAVVVGLAGVVVMTRPGTSVFEWVALTPVAAALCYAMMHMLSRKIGRTDRASVMAFYAESTFITASIAIGLLVGDGRFSGTGNPSLEFLLRAWRWPDQADLWLFVWCGVASGIGGFLLGQAYRLGEAAKVAPFEYVALPIATFWSFAIWGDVPDVTASLGMALILGTGMYILYRRNPGNIRPRLTR